MQLRPAQPAELDTVLAIHRAAFGSEEEAELVRELLVDPSAQPGVSLLAEMDGRAVRHILFTRARREEDEAVACALLAPLAVVPAAQGEGIGGALVERGVEMLREAGVRLVFVLGWPDYYPRFGFRPAGAQGLSAPYPIAEHNADAWMVRHLAAPLALPEATTVHCADALMEQKYWVE